MDTKQEAIDSKSNISDMLYGKSVQYPETKKEAIEFRDIDANVSLTKEMLNNLVAYHQSIGADKDLPTEKKALFGYLNRFHLQLAVKNPHWPEDLSFEYVYGAFINAIMYDRVSLKGYNIKAHIKAFKKWITQSGVEDQLVRDYYKKNPDERPKQLSENTNTRLEDWPDEWIRSQHETIQAISDSGIGNVSLFDSDNADSYFKRIKSEYRKRFNK